MIVALLIAAQIVWSGPRLSPSEAARILAQSPGLSNRTNVPPPGDGPTVVVIASSPTAGPFGEFAPFSPPRRLDGTLLSQRAWITRGYVGRRPGELFEQRRHLPPAFVGTGGGMGAGAGLRGPGSVAGGVTKTSGNPPKRMVR